MGNSSGAVVWRAIASSPPPGFGRPTGRVGGADSGSERKSPAPGFGAARPSSTHSGGTKSATRTDMLVDGGIETGCDNLEVLRHDGNKYGVNSSSTKELPQKGLKRKFVVDATKGASPGGNASNTGKQLRSCRKGKGPGKCAKLKDNDGATRLGRVQTPIDVFEDECVFCHSFRTSEPCHGPMVLYHNRRIVPSDEDNPTNAVYVHEKCMVWAPEVESNGDTFKNVESEISRAKRLRCSRCKLQGAALGCYDNSCRKTYHVPCAMMIPECHWDVENFRVWCPKHAPRDEMSSPTMESDILPPVLQNQCPAKEISADCRMEDEHINPLPSDGTRSPIIENDITSAVLQNHSSQCPAKETSVDCQMEDEHINPLPGDEMSSPIIESGIASTALQNHSSQCPAKEISGDHQIKDEHINPLVTSNSSLPAQVPGQYLVNEGTSVVHRREDLQVDQPNTSSSSLPQGQCLDNNFFSAKYRREEKLVNQSSTPVDQWVLLGIYLSASEKNKNGVNSSSTKELHQKGPKRKFAVDATKGASPGGNASNTEEQLRSCRKGKGPGKCAKLKDNDGSTGLGRVQTPIGVFEDECVFCHSFRTSEPCHGPMVLYHNRRIVPSDEGNPTNAVYVHEKCMVWAPEVESNGDTFKNVESEISRAKRLRCSRCKLRGAALGCYDESCRKTYHVPCAMMIPECRWDVENRRVWCPKHAPRDETSSPTMETLESDIVPPVLRNQCPAKEISVDCQMDDNQINPLPGDEMSSPITETDITSAVLQNHSSQCPAKEISDDCQMEDEHINPLPGDEMSSPINETDITSAVFKTHSSQCPAKEISSDCQMEDEHINPLVTSNSSLLGQVPGQYSVQEGTSVGHRREDLQVDQLNTLSSSLPQGQCSDKERISASSRREEKPVNQSSTPVDQWVLLGIYLNASEKDSLKEFASLTSSILAEKWDQNVTHVIVGRNAGDTCGRSYEALMAILSGKWIVTAGWIVDCLVEPIPDLKTCLGKPIPGPEISYEVNFCDGSHTSGYGPMKGRARATERAPKLFSGLHFCLSAYIDPEDKETIRRLVAAGEGQVLEGISPDRLHENLNRNPAEVYFIYDSGPPRKITSDFDLILGKEIQETVEYAKSGAQVISHTRLLNAILCYDARILERRLHQDM